MKKMPIHPNRPMPARTYTRYFSGNIVNTQNIHETDPSPKAISSGITTKFIKRYTGMMRTKKRASRYIFYRIQQLHLLECTDFSYKNNRTISLLVSLKYPDLLRKKSHFREIICVRQLSDVSDDGARAWRYT